VQVHRQRAADVGAGQEFVAHGPDAREVQLAVDLDDVPGTCVTGTCVTGACVSGTRAARGTDPQRGRPGRRRGDRASGDEVDGPRPGIGRLEREPHLGALGPVVQLHPAAHVADQLQAPAAVALVVRDGAPAPLVADVRVDPAIGVAGQLDGHDA
jgi:hypothetical protein